MDTTELREGNEPGLSEWERVGNAFTAPAKTFLDIRRNANWLLPFVLTILASLLFVWSVDRQVGFDQVAQNNIHRNIQAQQKISAEPEAQQQQTIHTIANFTRAISYATPAMTLIFGLIAAGLLMMSFNMGLEATASYKQYLAIWFYAGLPLLLKYVIAAITLFAGARASDFDIRNPVGTNLGWYLSTDTPLWLRTLLSHVDIFTIWVVVLLVIGCAIVARVKRSSAAMVVVGWWILIILVGTVGAIQL